MKNYGFENHAALIDHLNLEFTMKPLVLEETPYSLFFYINNRQDFDRKCLVMKWRKKRIINPRDLQYSLYQSTYFILVEIICANQSDSKLTKILSNFSLREINQLTLTWEK